MKKDQKGMTLRDKEKYINKISKRYHASGKVKRGQILDEVCAILIFQGVTRFVVLTRGISDTRSVLGKRLDMGRVSL